MATRRRYSAADKARAVGIAVVKGQRPAAEETGIPLGTIHSWFERPEFEQLKTEKRENVQAMFWAGIQVGVKAVVEGLQGEAKLSEKAIALGVLYDKFALLSGGVTERTEQRNLSDALNDHEVATLRRVLDEVPT